jgi:hypothetical protein
MVWGPLLVLQQVNIPDGVGLARRTWQRDVLPCVREVRTFSCSAHGGSRELEGSMS